MPKSTARSDRRRSPGEGTIYAFRGGHRRALAWTEPDGTRRKRIVSARTSAEARQKLDALRRELQSGTLAPAGPTQTVGAYLTEWIDLHRSRVRPSTRLTAESYVRIYLIPALGRHALVRLTSVDVERALASFVRDGRPVVAGDTRRRSPVSAVTARHVRAVLRRALSDAQRAGIVARNVAADAVPPRIEHRPITYLTARDLGRLLEATADDG